MTGIETVTLVSEWVEADFDGGGFEPHECEEVLADVDRLREQLLTWDRDPRDCTERLTGRSETVYRRRQGGFRIYFARQGSVLYCVGVGRRRTTYDRDLDRIDRRIERL